MILDTFDLTDTQLLLALRAKSYPAILQTRGQAITATSLFRRGWGGVEAGGGGEKIFRLNQAGCDAIKKSFPT